MYIYTDVGIVYIIFLTISFVCKINKIINNFMESFIL